MILHSFGRLECTPMLVLWHTLIGCEWPPQFTQGSLWWAWKTGCLSGFWLKLFMRGWKQLGCSAERQTWDANRTTGEDEMQKHELIKCAVNKHTVGGQRALHVTQWIWILCHFKACCIRVIKVFYKLLLPVIFIFNNSLFNSISFLKTTRSR